jgi:steroid delta-isomerase-like uncharacterized protein
MTNRELVTMWFDQVWNAGDESAIDRLMAPAAKFHGLAPDGGAVVGPEGFKPFYRQMRQAFPDIRMRILRIISEGDSVAVHCAVSGTHRGPGLGPKITGSAVAIEGMAVATVRDGQLQEGWNFFDFMTLYQKVGLLPALGAVM